MPSEKKELDSDETRLYAYHAPALEGGPYRIDLKQSISLGDERLPPIESSKGFIVEAPEFSIPPTDIHSVYPPNGHADDARVLPHVILEDPHLPWERPMPGNRHDGQAANLMPWLGVLTFTADELCTASNTTEFSAFKVEDTSSIRLNPDQIKNLPQSINLPLDRSKVRELLSKSAESTDTSTQDTIDFVFLRENLFRSIFTLPKDSINASESELSLEKFAYMSHVRVVHTKGMARSGGGIANDGSENELSVVVSPRSGPPELASTDAKTVSNPVPMMAHLISLEGILENIRLPHDQSKEKQIFGLVSLHSWTYMSLPPDADNYLDLFENLGDSYDSLKVSVEEAPVKNPSSPGQTGEPDTNISEDDKAQLWYSRRMSHGYSFIKYRPLTGEETIALYHGPLTPQRHDKGRDGSVGQIASNDGSDLQIVDADAGIPDLSYHLGWQLGRGMASSDRTFSASLMRLRARIHSTAEAARLGKSTLAHLTEPPVASAKDKAAAEISEKVTSGQTTLTNLQKVSPHLRWNRLPQSESMMSKGSIDLDPQQVQALIQIAADHILGGSETLETESETGEHSDGGKDTKTSDWAVVWQWIVQKMMILEMPSIYLFPDPQALPAESLRTFYVDETWMNVFVDGALSVANHASFTEVDFIRREIKRNLNKKVFSKATENQMPRWGFIVRSKVVEAFPDLQITAPWPENTFESKISKFSEIASMTHLASDTLLCLFDRCPEDSLEDNNVFPDGITISQPPHQQRFSIGESLTSDSMSMTFKMMGAEGPEDTSDELEWFKGAAHPVRKKQEVSNLDSVYDWKTRCLIFPAFMKACMDSQKFLKHPFQDAGPNSAFAALQLIDVPLTLSLKSLAGSKDPNVPKWNSSTSPWRTRELPLGVNEELGQRGQNEPDLELTNMRLSTIIIGQHARKDRVFNFPRLVSHPEAKDLVLRSAVSNFVIETCDQGTLQTPTTSMITKDIWPLGLYRRTIPSVDRQSPIDLVFSIKADGSSDKSITLQSLMVILPAGRDAADLLQASKEDPKALTMLPRVEVVGKGRRWHATSREMSRYSSYFKKHVSITGRRRMPTTCLMIKLTQRGEVTELARQPDLSFTLVGCDLNNSPSADVRIVFVEQYATLKGVGKATMLTGYTKVEKERPLA